MIISVCIIFHCIHAHAWNGSYNKMAKSSYPNLFKIIITPLCIMLSVITFGFVNFAF